MTDEQKVPDDPGHGSETFSKGYTILKELQGEGKIDASSADEYKARFYKLHQQLEQNYGNEKLLLQRGHSLKKSL